MKYGICHVVAPEDLEISVHAYYSVMYVTFASVVNSDENVGSIVTFILLQVSVLSLILQIIVKWPSQLLVLFVCHVK